MRLDGVVAASDLKTLGHDPDPEYGTGQEGGEEQEGGSEEDEDEFDDAGEFEGTWWGVGAQTVTGAILQADGDEEV